MLVLWMTYAAALTAIVAGSALALERLAAIWNMPRRAVWLAALVVATAVPVALSLRRDPVRHFAEVLADVRPLAQTPRTSSSDAVRSPAPARFYVPRSFSRKWDAPVRNVWLVASALL